MSFTEAVKQAFANYANFKGRARRSEYWYFTLFNLIVSAVISVLSRFIPVLSILSVVYSLAVIIPGLSITWRRLHDIGKSGAWYFICLIPLVGVILLLIWCCTDSQPDNQYGFSPKYSTVS